MNYASGYKGLACIQVEALDPINDAFHHIQPLSTACQKTLDRLWDPSIQAVVTCRTAQVQNVAALQLNAGGALGTIIDR